MALHKTKIHCDLPRTSRNNNLAHQVFFVQHYAPIASPDVISDRHTYWSRLSYSSKGELVKNIKSQKIIDDAKVEFAAEAAEMHFKGFVAVGFVISIGHNVEGYAVDSFDLDHINKLVMQSEYDLNPLHPEPGFRP